MGHLFLGLASLAPLLIPGLLYSLTTFLHYQGDIMQCGVGKPFNIPSSKLGKDFYDVEIANEFPMSLLLPLSQLAA